MKDYYNGEHDDEYENEEKNPALDMYYDDGTFRPLVASHGNVSGDIAYYRNVYMEAEREYFTKLLERDDVRGMFIDYLNYSSDELLYAAKIHQERLENGELETREELEKMKSMTPRERDKYHMYKLESTEGLIALLLAAIKDKALILELVLTPSRRR